jgi:hypothetical protein
MSRLVKLQDGQWVDANSIESITVDYVQTESGREGRLLVRARLGDYRLGVDWSFARAMIEADDLGHRVNEARHPTLAKEPDPTPSPGPESS